MSSLILPGRYNLFLHTISFETYLNKPRRQFQCQRLLTCSIIVNKGMSLAIWKCPPNNTSDGDQWWCGDERKTSACQTGRDAHFVSYISGIALAIPTTISTPSSAAKDPSTASTSLSSSLSVRSSPSTATDVSSTDHPSTNAATSAQGRPQSSSVPTAIGVGIGVPLGIAALGILGFLCIRQAKKKKDQTEFIGLSSESERTPSVGGVPVAELQDAPLPYEMGDDGSPEMPGTAAQIVPIL